MKSLRKRKYLARCLKLICFICLLFLGLSPSFASNLPKVIQVTIHDYPPLIGKKLPHHGILTRIVTEIFAKEGIQIQPIFVPNNRAITGVMDGMYEASLGWAHSEERDAKLLYPENSLYNFRMIFFQQAEKIYPWKKLEDLARFQIGITYGNHYSDEFTKLQKAGVLKVQGAPSDNLNMKKLASGRIDLFPMEQEAGELLKITTLTLQEQKMVVAQKEALWEIPVFFVISKTHPHGKEILALFDKGYLELKKSGKLKALIEETRQSIQKQLKP